MTLLPGHKAKWGIDWIIPIVLAFDIPKVDVREEFSQTLDFDSLRDLKGRLWHEAKWLWLHRQVQKKVILTFDNKAYFFASDIEVYLHSLHKHQKAP